MGARKSSTITGNTFDFYIRQAFVGLSHYIDVFKTGLADLRKALAIIPQDAVCVFVDLYIYNLFTDVLALLLGPASLSFYVSKSTVEPRYYCSFWYTSFKS